MPSRIYQECHLHCEYLKGNMCIYVCMYIWNTKIRHFIIPGTGISCNFLHFLAFSVVFYHYFPCFRLFQLISCCFRLRLKPNHNIRQTWKLPWMDKNSIELSWGEMSCMDNLSGLVFSRFAKSSGWKPDTQKSAGYPP